jgi:hypothetical protein
LFRSLYTHGLSRQIGITGALVDAGKVSAALANDDPKGATGYSLFGLGNLRFAGLFPKLPRTPYILALGLASQAIPSEYYNFVYRNAVKPAFQAITNPISAFFARLTQLPPEGHWSKSSNVLIDNLRITTGFRVTPKQTPTPRKKQNS